MPRLTPRRSGERGQALVMMVGGFAAMIALVALIVDGGNFWSQQRNVQNGSDAAAEAGAVVLAQKLSGQALAPGTTWDQRVDTAVHTTATANGLNGYDAYYTDICGIPLKPDGTAALVPVTHTYDFAAAAQVGAGFPTELSTTPDCPSSHSGPPAGVLVIGYKNVGTYLARVVGLETVHIATNATAVSGWLQGICDSSEGEACALLPVTIPTAPIACTGSGDAVPVPGQPEWLSGPVYRIPLCKNDAGNVGWLDWDPPHGGTSFLVDSILHPNNPPIDLPSWQYVSETGNVNSPGVEDAINTYRGQIVLVPMFDVTCYDTPNFSQVDVPDLYGCSSPGGHGVNHWYRFPAFAAFRLCSAANLACTVGGFTYAQGAYITGSNEAICGVDWHGAGCLVGQFVNIIRTGTVGANGGGGTSPTKVVGVQLIR